MEQALFLKVKLLVLFASFCTCLCVVEEMEKHGIVPDVITVAPEEIATIKFGDTAVNLGNELTPTQVKNPPSTLEWKADSQALYTVCMVDPDAPSRNDPKFREWQHWLVVNIPENDISKGEVLSEYIGSGPPKGTGLHRYVFLIYKQEKKIVTTNIRKLGKSTANRGKFSILNFAKENHLGNPIAGNFYQAQWDDYVPILYKQLEDK